MNQLTYNSLNFWLSSLSPLHPHSWPRFPRQSFVFIVSRPVVPSLHPILVTPRGRGYSRSAPYPVD